MFFIHICSIIILSYVYIYFLFLKSKKKFIVTERNIPEQETKDTIFIGCLERKKKVSLWDNFTKKILIQVIPAASLHTRDRYVSYKYNYQNSVLQDMKTRLIPQQSGEDI